MNVAAEPAGRLRRWVPRAGGARLRAGVDEGTDGAAAGEADRAHPVGRLKAVLALAPPVDVDGPRVRLGLAWGATTLVLLGAFPLGLTLVLAVAAMAAAAQAATSWRGLSVGPWRPVAVIGALLLPLSAMAGPLGVGVMAAGVVAVAVIGERLLGNGAASLSAAIPLALGAPAAGLLLVRSEVGVAAALTLLLLLHLWDASVFVVGSGADNRWEGHLAAAASVAAASVLIASVLVPPFRGLTPAVLGAAAVLTAPLGPYVATLLLGDRERRAPAVRRLDALIVAVPVWGALAALLLG